MAVKHVVDYYNQVTKNYLEMKQELKDMEELLADKSISPEMVEQMKCMIQPIKTNYETLSYFMFLLNQPAKKSKTKRYENQNKKLLQHCRTKDSLLQENQEALVKLKEFKEENK